MSSVRRLDTEKLRAGRIIATASLTAVAVAFLLLSGRSAPASPTPAAEPSSSQAAADQQVPSDPPEAAQKRAVRARMELEPLALYATSTRMPSDQNADDPEANQITPARLEPTPAPNPSPKGSEQTLFKSRRASETMDPREFLRYAR
jgi:hypothetical protein